MKVERVGRVVFWPLLINDVIGRSFVYCFLTVSVEGVAYCELGWVGLFGCMIVCNVLV